MSKKVKRVGVRGGRDAAQSDFGGYDSGGYDPAPSPSPSSKVSTINVTDRPVFDISKVGDPALNPKSKNFNVRDDNRFAGYVPSFTPKPNRLVDQLGFINKAFNKGKTYLNVARPFLGTFLNLSGIKVPKGISQAIALYSLAKNMP